MESQEQTEVKKRGISCEGCVFAVPYTAGGPFRQVGCRMGRVDKFREQGCLDDGGDYLKVVDRVCNARREYPWGEAISHREQEEVVREEIRLKTAAILVVHGFDSQADIELSLSTLLAKDDEGRPVFDEVFVVRNQSMKGAKEFHSRLEEILTESGHPRASFIQMAEPDSVLVALDQAVAAVKEAAFYMVVTPGTRVSPSFSSRLNHFINEQVKRFVVLTPRGGELNGLTVHTMTHRKLNVGGNAPVEFTDAEGNKEVISRVDRKIQRMAREMEQEWAVEVLDNLQWTV